MTRFDKLYEKTHPKTVEDTGVVIDSAVEDFTEEDDDNKKGKEVDITEGDEVDGLSDN